MAVSVNHEADRSISGCPHIKNTQNTTVPRMVARCHGCVNVCVCIKERMRGKFGAIYITIDYLSQLFSQLNGKYKVLKLLLFVGVTHQSGSIYRVSEQQPN